MSRTSVKPIGSQVHNFELYPTSQLSRSKFNRSHSLLTCLNSGYLVPIWNDEALPGDTLIISCSTLSRLAAQIVPFMDNVYMDVHFWCVPYRLVWSHWVNFMGQQDNKYDPSNPTAGTDYLTPQLNSGETGVDFMSIYDYFGVTPGVANLDFNSFLFRAYNLVWNEWYRDTNLQDPVTVRLGDNGVDQLADFTLLKRGKRKDYFTSALPTPNRVTVDLPLGNTAPVYAQNDHIEEVQNLLKNGEKHLLHFSHSTGNNNEYWAHNETVDHKALGVTTNGNARYYADGDVASGFTPRFVTPDNLIADLKNATGATINSFIQAFAIQNAYYLDNIGGTRYISLILSHFKVKSPDGRLQRPEFLGGGTFNLNLNVVPQTSASESNNTPQGNLASYGVINGSTKTIVHSFTEHCVVFAVASIRVDLTYQQGLHRNFSRRTRFDYYLPALANLGEQAILNKEIFAQGNSVVDTNGVIVDDKVLGYAERWAEYRYKSNEITGIMRSDASQSLDIWHLAQDFSSVPTLNADFIEENPPISRVLAVTGDNVPEFICNFWFDEYWVRPMPVYSVPNLQLRF